MIFLNPFALLGLALIGIPIAIHLLNKLQPKQITWAAMRFLQESVIKNQRRVRLEDLLLLILRCLLFIFLILALSKPAWQARNNSAGSARATAVIILDNSYSMGLSNGVQTRFGQAQAAAEEILRMLPSGSAAALFLAADHVQPVIAQPTFDFNLLRKTIRQAQLTDRATDLAPALHQATETLQKKDYEGAKEIYLITDGQANGWRQLESIRKQFVELKKQIALQVILVGDQTETNLAITRLRLESGLTPVDQSLRCNVEVKNESQTEARDVRVSLFVDNEPASDEAILPSIPAKSSSSTALFAKLRSAGYHTITAKIPPDRLAADDRRSIVVHAIREVKVLLVEGVSSSTVSQADDFFVRNALVPVPAAEIGRYYIKTTTIAAPQLGGSSLDNYDAIFLLDVETLTSAQVEAVTRYVNQGGGLTIFPGPHTNAEFYNKTLGGGGFLPAELGALKGQAGQRDKPFTVQTKDYDHPITTLWNDPAVGTLSSVHFYAYYPMTVKPWKSSTSEKENSPAGEPRVLFRFSEGDPVAVEHTWGLGRVILFSSTATTIWNDLPVRQAFVPLMHRVLGSLVERQDDGLNLRVGQKFSYNVSPQLLNKEIKVTLPGDQEKPRIVGRVTLVNTVPVASFNETDMAGRYQLAVASDPVTLLYFATQGDPAESDLTPLSADQVKSLQGAGDVLKWSSDASLNHTFKSGRDSTKLWFPLLIAAFILASVETFVAQRFTQSK